MHTGKTVSLSFKPAVENTGYVFVREDLEGAPEISADIQYVTNTDRGTNLEKDSIKIQTTEHVLAALVGLEIDNCFIHLNAPEPPIMDGSSKFFVDALLKAGIEKQKEAREEFIVDEVISFKDETSGSELTIIPSETYQITTMVDFGTKILGTQNATLDSLIDFKDTIAPARTFSFLHELETLLDNGLIKGGDLNNAIVYVDKPLSESTTTKLKKAFDKDHISIKPNGILDNLDLHFFKMKPPGTNS